MPTSIGIPPASTNGHHAVPVKKLHTGNGVDRDHGMGEFFAAADASDVYAAAERLTGPVAGPLLEHAGLLGEGAFESAAGETAVLDLACGTGVVSATLQEAVRERGVRDRLRLVCADISAPQIRWVRRRMMEEGWANTEAVVTDGSKTTLPSNTFDFAVMAMALMLVPDPRNTLKECYRMLKPGGTFAASTWLVEGWVPDTRDAIAAAKLPGNPPWPETSDELVATWALGPWHSAPFVGKMLRAAGFEDVRTEVVTRHIAMRDADDFCVVFRAFVRVVTDVYWTARQRAELLPLVEPALKTFLEGKHGVGKSFTVERTRIMASGRRPA